jgi:RHS repeat-associated protein
MSQSFQYDWLGNTTSTDDDAHGFYDRSLGTVTNGAATQGPYQLLAAQGAAATVSPQGGGLTAAYDAAGNLTSLAVARNGPCLPTGASCSQRFAYEWDEVGRLVDARRWDGVSGSATDPAPLNAPNAELRYAYDASDQRTLKTAVGAAQGGSDAQTVYVFGGLELRRTTWVPTAQDYVRSNSTEVGYLFAHGVRLARLYYAVDSVPTASSGQLHVLIDLPGHLGSTSIVIDHDTSELVEAATYLPSGSDESTYRPLRWASFREDYGFTGKEDDVEVGLLYFGARFLSPALGRWASPDPVAVHGLASDLNVYAYVRGQLFRMVDAAGLAGDDGANTARHGEDDVYVDPPDPNASGISGDRAASTPLQQKLPINRVQPTQAPSEASAGPVGWWGDCRGDTCSTPGGQHPDTTRELAEDLHIYKNPDKTDRVAAVAATWAPILIPALAPAKGMSAIGPEAPPDLPPPVDAPVSAPTVELHSPYQIPVEPGTPGPAPSVVIDTSKFDPSIFGTTRTSNGGLRSAYQFWQEWLEKRPETLSDVNKKLIMGIDPQTGVPRINTSPNVDQQFLKYFPQYAAYEHTPLLHHHIGEGPLAMPVPAETHPDNLGPWHGYPLPDDE